MPFEQAIRLVTQPPESLAYHLIILLSLQVTFSVALWQWRYDDEAVDSWRLWVAAGVMFLLRLGTAIALTASNDLGQRFLLPPLERAIDLATVLLLLWAIIPSLRAFPRLTDSLLLISLIGVFIGYVLSAPAWNRLVLQDVAYRDSDQIVMWAVAHLVLLLAGMVWLVSRRPFDWFLRSLVLLPLGIAQGLLLTQVLPASSVASGLPAEVTTLAIPFWMRLGYVFSFPILASLAYRQNLAGLLFSRNSTAESLSSVESLLNSVNTLLDKTDVSPILSQMAELMFDRVRTSFVGFGIKDENQPGLLQVAVYHKNRAGESSVAEWALTLSNWTAIEMAIRDDQLVELASSGMGARQYFDLKRELNLPIDGSILISPLNRIRSDEATRDEEIAENYGFLLLGKNESGTEWSITERILVRPLSRLLAQVLNRPDGEIRFVEIPAVGNEGIGLSPAEIAILEQEAGASLKLRKDISLLRESLRTAEEALAVASAGESGLSTEWVTRAITHYSGELEEAQLKISQLEDQLNDIVNGPAFDALVLLSEEIRTPVTAIQGYVGVLLADREVKLPFEYRHLLERVQLSAAKIDDLMEQFDQNVHQVGTLTPDEPQSQLFDVVEMALEALKSNFREKRLGIDLDISEDLPDVNLLARDLYHLLILILRLIIEASAPKSKLSIKAQTVNRDPYLQFELRVSDPDVVHKLRPELLNDQSAGQSKQSLNGSGDDFPDPSIYQIIKRHQTRLWVDSQPGSGTIIIFLLPVVPQLIKE